MRRSAGQGYRLQKSSVWECCIGVAARTMGRTCTRSSINNGVRCWDELARCDCCRTLQWFTENAKLRTYVLLGIIVYPGEQARFNEHQIKMIQAFQNSW